jgi:adenylate cyclase
MALLPPPNRLPQASADFPSAWVGEFEQELTRTALRRARTGGYAVFALELVYLAMDSFQTRWFEHGMDALSIWRLTVLIFLLTYRFGVERSLAAPYRLRYFLVAGMLLSTGAAAILAGTLGDLSPFAIGALGFAAASPLPRRFNMTLFASTGLALAAWLWWQVPGFSRLWIDNIAATCVLGVVIERFSFQTALQEFTQRKAAERQRERSDELLYQVFPGSVATALKTGQRSVALHGEVTILFADVVGFTRLSKQLLPSQLVQVLEDLFGRFDALAEEHGVEKVKTIGDAYMAVTGAPLMVDQPVHRMAAFALDIVSTCQEYAQAKGLQLAVRVGIHTGPVVAGVIGSARLCYDLWGDSVNTAQRMESHSEPNTVCVSEPVYFSLREHFRLSSRGVVDIKGVGPTPTYALLERQPAAARDHQTSQLGRA